MRRTSNSAGFTIVELMIVIIVIAILAAISIVAYTGIQDRARGVVLGSDLSNAADQMEIAYAMDGSYPADLPEGIRTSGGNVLQLVQQDSSDEFCINGWDASGLMQSYSTGTGLGDGLCYGALIGSPVGGSVPAVVRNTNLVPDFSQWTTSGGITYNAGSNELVFGSTSGQAESPLIRVDRAGSARFTLDTYVTQSSPHFTPRGGLHLGSNYFNSNLVATQNTTGHTGNGHANSVALNQWVTYGWTMAMGPNIEYLRLRISSSPTSYTSNNRIRNPVLTIF